MEITSNKIVVKKELISSQTVISVLVIGTALASSYAPHTTSNVIENTIQKTQYLSQSSIVNKEKYTTFNFYAGSNVETLDFNDYSNQVSTIKAKGVEGFIYSNKQINEHNTHQNDIIYIEDKVKGVSALQHLIERRNSIEKVASITGIALGSLSLMTPLLSIVEWSATLPASLLFFSLPTLMFFRRKVRRQYYES